MATESSEAACREVEVRIEDYLGEKWRDAVISAEIPTLLPMAVVRLDVQLLENDPYEGSSIPYWLIVGPNYEDELPIVFVVSPEAYVEEGRWDAYDVASLNRAVSDEPGDDISNALYAEDGSDLLDALIGTKCGPLEIRDRQTSSGS